MNDPIALTAGDWVPRRGIKVWVPDPSRPPTYCGTERGYQWHRYHQREHNWPLPKSDPCGCRAAHAAWNWFRDRMSREQEAAA